MAPEAALGGSEIDARVDLYGLGCVGYWLLTGERVFAGRTPVEVLLHHVKTAARPAVGALRTARPARSRGARPLLPRQGAGDRPPSAEWLAARLAERERADWTPERARAWWKVSASGAPDVRLTGATGTAGTPVAG